MDYQQEQVKRKLPTENNESNKRIHLTTNETDMIEIIQRPKTPPLGMTLSHFNPTTGTYHSSEINSDREIKSPICTGMTPVYRAPFERWGSCLI